jgi:hypothetical protein
LSAVLDAGGFLPQTDSTESIERSGLFVRTTQHDWFGTDDPVTLTLFDANSRPLARFDLLNFEEPVVRLRGFLLA